MRLQKYLALCGVASRRKCEELISAGEVKVNGECITVQGTTIDDEIDLVQFDGRRIVPREYEYYVLNKPPGYVTTNAATHGERTVFDLVHSRARLFAVGRLDKETSGLLILTNDGDWANRIAHPSRKVSKTYLAVFRRKPDPEQLRRLASGVMIEGRPARAVHVRTLGHRDEGWMLEIVMHEGRNRIVRRMCEAAGLDLIALARTVIGDFRDDNLPVGSCRKLRPEERLRIEGGAHEEMDLKPRTAARTGRRSQRR